MSGGSKGIQDLLNTTPTTPNLTMNIKAEMQMMILSTPDKEGGEDKNSSRFINFHKLRLMHCNHV